MTRLRSGISAKTQNLFDQKTANSRFFIRNQTDLPITAEQYLDPKLPRIDVESALLQQGILQDPRFLKDNGFLGAREVRLGAKVTF